MKNFISAKDLLILDTSKVDQQDQTIENSILLLLQRNRIDLSKCHTQACDGASPMSSEASGAVSVIKKEKPLAEYTHCRNYILNLAISYAI